MRWWQKLWAKQPSRVIADKPLQAQTMRFNSWYASADNLKLDLSFYTTLKANQLVKLTKEAKYIHFDQIAWSPSPLASTILIKVKAVAFKVQIFKLVTTNGGIK